MCYDNNIEYKLINLKHLENVYFETPRGRRNENHLLKRKREPLNVFKNFNSIFLKDILICVCSNTDVLL